MTNAFHNDYAMPLERYKEMKLEMLQKHCHVPITPEQREHFLNLPNEYAVDRYFRTLIMQYVDPNY